MKDKKTVFVLGAGASCPYGYPSGARLRKSICLNQEFMQNYCDYLRNNKVDQADVIRRDVQQFKDAFTKSSIKSIDIFMANNPKLAPVGKYIIAFEVFSAEQKSRFREEAKLWQELSRNPPKSWTKTDSILRREDFQGEDWCSYLYNRFIEGLIGRDVLPDFSIGDIAFITFNYDRSLEYFLYESFSNSFTEVPESQVIQFLKNLKILHVYGQIMPLKWQDSNEGVDYKPQEISESLLQKAAKNIKTIYEQKESSELDEARSLLKKAEQIFFLGFGYAPENMEVLGLPGLIHPKCLIYGTAFNLIKEEAERIESAINHGRRKAQDYFDTRPTKIESDVDCLMLLRKYLILR